jgi:hypothetical protein
MEPMYDESGASWMVARKLRTNLDMIICDVLDSILFK